MAKRTASQISEAVAKDVPITVVEDFDVGLLKIKQTGLNEEEMPILKVRYDTHRLILNLAPGKKWLQVKWKIEASPFDGPNPSRLGITLAVDDDTAATIAKIEDELRPVVLEKTIACIQKQCKVKPDVAWKSAVRETLFTAKLQMSSKEPAYLTQCKIRPFKQQVLTVAGKDQLQPLLNENYGFMGAKAKATVCLEGAYVVRKGMPNHAAKVGLTWVVKQLVADLPEPREKVQWVVPDVFADVAWEDDE